MLIAEGSNDHSYQVETGAQPREDRQSAAVRELLLQLDALRSDVRTKFLDLHDRIDAIAAAPVTLEAIEADPERYVRIQITKNTKGYAGESTVSLRGESWGWDDLQKMLQQADRLMREEIARRERIDSVEVSM